VRLMGLLLATVALVATALQSHAAAPLRDLAAAPKQPQTLYASPSGTIDAFAQDGRCSPGSRRVRRGATACGFSR